MMHMHQLDFTPSSSEWIYQTTLSKPIIAVFVVSYAKGLGNLSANSFTRAVCFFTVAPRTITRSVFSTRLI
jgi:hypothetical protein